MTNFQLLLELSNIGYGAKLNFNAAFSSRERTGRKLRQI